MTSGRAIDHIGIAAPDLQKLARQYEELGFTLTPQAYHPDHIGTTNRLVQMAKRNFLELISANGPPSAEDGLNLDSLNFGTYTQWFLTRRSGINLVVFQTDDRDADLARWRAAGLDTYEPFNFERLATLPDGTQQTVRFELGFVTHPDIDCLFFVCDNKAEEHFWKPEFQTHENGGDEIVSIIMASQDLARDAAFLSTLFDGDISPRGCGLSIDCGPQRIDIVPPKKLQETGWDDAGSDKSHAAGLHLHNGKGLRQRVNAERAGNTFIQWVD